MSALKIWRKSRGISQQALAERLGVDRSMVSRIEAGRRTSLPVARQVEIATNGEVTAASLLGLKESPKTARRASKNLQEDGAAFEHAGKPWRAPATLAVEIPLTAGELEDLRKYLPDLDAVAREGALKALRETYKQAWSEANREAIEANARWIEEHGTFAEQMGLI